MFYMTTEPTLKYSDNSDAALRISQTKCCCQRFNSCSDECSRL